MSSLRPVAVVALAASLAACLSRPPSSPTPHVEPADTTAVVHAVLYRYHDGRITNAIDTVTFSAHTGRDLPAHPASTPSFPPDSTLFLNATRSTSSSGCTINARGGIKACPSWWDYSKTFQVAPLRASLVIRKKSYDGEDARAEAALYGPGGEVQWRTPFPSYFRSITLHGTTLLAIEDRVYRRFENTTIGPWGAADSLFVHRFDLSLDSMAAASPVAYPLDPPASISDAYVVLPYD